MKITCSILAWRTELDYIQFTAWHVAVQMEYVHAYAPKTSKPKSKIRWNYMEISQNGKASPVYWERDKSGG